MGRNGCPGTTQLADKGGCFARVDVAGKMLFELLSSSSKTRGESKFGGTSGVEFMTWGINRYKMMGVKNKEVENDFFGNWKED